MNYSEFFIYFLKTCALLVMFWGLYKAFLSRETFFMQNRWFLLAGAAISIILPLWTIERTEIIQVALASSEIYTAPVESTKAETLPVPSAEAVLFYIYSGGVVLFSLKLILQLLSLKRLISKGERRKLKGMNLIYSGESSSPFSFFNQIVLPKSTIGKEEENTILAHEYIHVKQWHSLDVLSMHLLTIFMWINPIAWIYRREVAQNLEYLADKGASKKISSAREYQYTLLKQHLTTKQLSIINPFINSLIKNRIVMLQKCPSNKTRLWQFGIALPLLVAFVLLFNVKTVAQYQFTETVSGPNGSSYSTIRAAQETLDFIIHNQMDDAQLKTLQESVASKGGTLKLKKLKRNSEGLITTLEVKFSFEDSAASANYSVPEGIPDIYIGVKQGGGVYLTTDQSFNTEKEFVWISGEGDQKEINKEIVIVTKTDSLLSKEGENTFVIKGSDKNAVWVTKPNSEEEKKFVIIQETEEGRMDENGQLTKTIKVTVSEDEENVFHIKGDSSKHEKIIVKKLGAVESEEEKSSIHVIRTNGEKPLMIVDGKETKEDVMRTMDPGMIDHIEVLKGEKAIETYGEKGKDGVILITTKKDSSKKFIPGPAPSTEMTEIDWAATKVFIDGKEVTEKEVDKLNPDTIDEIEVFKGDKAQEKYGKPNAILITTKKQ